MTLTEFAQREFGLTIEQPRTKTNGYRNADADVTGSAYKTPSNGFDDQSQAAVAPVSIQPELCADC